MPVLKPLVGNPDGPAQYKQPSRKGKKAWRKNVDVSEIEQGLEELQAQIIDGGVIAEKASTELFTVDVTRDKALSKNLPKKIKTLKADEIIAQRSAVPALQSRKKRAGDKTTDGLLPAKRQRTTEFVSHKDLARLRRVADGQHEGTVAMEDAAYDVWGEPEAPKEPKSTFLFEKTKAKPPKTLRHQPISLVASGKAVPAVPKPKGASSYNPTAEEYEERLTQEMEKAVEAERKRLAELEEERLRAEAAARSAAEAEAAEARADLSEWEDDSAWEGFESGGEELGEAAVKSKKRPERKTQAQRNRIKRRKEEERRLKHEAALKKKNAQAEKIRQIAAEVEERQRELELMKMTMSDDSELEDEDDIEMRRKQLGKFKLPEKDLELLLPDELTDSLRLLKPEGNLLKDRYRSLLVRGKVEARRNVPFRKQAKSKITEKWTYKDFNI